MTTRVDDFRRARFSALSASIRSKGIPILSLVRFLFLLSFFLSDGRVDDSWRRLRSGFHANGECAAREGTTRRFIVGVVVDYDVRQ